MTRLLDEWPEPDTETVAQRLRMHMGDKKISRSALALASGVKRSALSAKLDGHTDFTVPEVIAIAHAIGKPWLWVLTGRENDEGPPDPTRNKITDRYRVRRASRSHHLSVA